MTLAVGFGDSGIDEDESSGENDVDDRGSGEVKGVGRAVVGGEIGDGESGCKTGVSGMKRAGAAGWMRLVCVFGDEGAVQHDHECVILHAVGWSIGSDTVGIHAYWSRRTRGRTAIGESTSSRRRSEGKLDFHRCNAMYDFSAQS